MRALPYEEFKELLRNNKNVVLFCCSKFSECEKSSKNFCEIVQFLLHEHIEDFDKVYKEYLQICDHDHFEENHSKLYFCDISQFHSHLLMILQSLNISPEINFSNFDNDIFEKIKNIFDYFIFRSSPNKIFGSCSLEIKSE